ncbi:dihydropyrimidinase [Anaerotruncus rubiinfantis]|uniref:dihydropyrimidinase n=1 Tax=Anaerotruncus rubiinfantis TaxID=1720200 RepID=UPI00082FE860|nr:dihydropyrimidinase [Anaerotruncus rubiinfantis]
MDLIIRGGTVVTPRESYEADVRITEGRISAVGRDLAAKGCETYDASGCKLFPGFIDAHTHLDMDTGAALTADDFVSGTRAAAAGGTTMLLDFATQDRGGTLCGALDVWHGKADGKSSCDYGFHMAITDWNEMVSRELDEMARQGVTSFKCYLAYDNLRISDGQLYEILKRVGQLHGIVGVHCENGDLVNEMIAENRRAGNLSTEYHPLSRPDFVEAEAIARYCYIAKAAGVPVNIVHLSTRMGLEEALRARARGQKVYIESCPQYFAFDDNVYSLPDFAGAKYVCSPPVRKPYDQRALWDALAKGEIDTVSTDHCSFNWKGQKELGREDFSKIPNGLPGIEHRPAVMYTLGVAAGRMTENQMAAMLSENTARLFGMYPRKGVIAPGADADIVVWDPTCCWTITAADMEQKVDYTPYEGMRMQGKAKAVFLRGQLVAAGGKVLMERKGVYVPRGESEYF